MDDPQPSTAPAEDVIAATRTWMEKAVIGLGLCPFAAHAHVRDQIRYVVSDHSEPDDLLEDLAREAQLLHATNPKLCETTLLIHPRALSDFYEYNEFLAVADEALSDLDLEGELQVASFHPGYQFAGTSTDDIENFTNRSPYPMLHLLREASVTRAVDTYPDVDDIGPRNIETLRSLGHEGWKRLWLSA